jgi:hypothetical protein
MESNERPVPSKSIIAFAAASSTTSGRIEGPALKLYFFIAEKLLKFINNF